MRKKDTPKTYPYKYKTNIFINQVLVVKKITLFFHFFVFLRLAFPLRFFCPDFSPQKARRTGFRNVFIRVRSFGFYAKKI